jgi:hypothetical protein
MSEWYVNKTDCSNTIGWNHHCQVVGQISVKKHSIAMLVSTTEWLWIVSSSSVHVSVVNINHPGTCGRSLTKFCLEGVEGGTKLKKIGENSVTFITSLHCLFWKLRHTGSLLNVKFIKSEFICDLLRFILTCKHSLCSYTNIYGCSAGRWLWVALLCLARISQHKRFWIEW